MNYNGPAVSKVIDTLFHSLEFQGITIAALVSLRLLHKIQGCFYWKKVYWKTVLPWFLPDFIPWATHVLYNNSLLSRSITYKRLLVLG